MSIGCVDRFLEEACGSSKGEMGPTNEIVPTYSTEEGGPGWVACTGMEKSELLHCSCEIIGTTCNGVGDRGRPVLGGCDCVMQWYHVEVTGWVFISGEDNLPILVNIHGHRTKVDGAPMSAELRHINNAIPANKTQKHSTFMVIHKKNLPMNNISEVR